MILARLALKREEPFPGLLSPVPVPRQSAA